MGRPRIDKNHKRDNKIMIRLTDPEYKNITKIAEEKNTPKAQILHDLIFFHLNELPEQRQEVRELKPDDHILFEKLCIEFSRIGNNLNQIARRLNSGERQNEKLEMEIEDCIFMFRNLSFKLENEICDVDYKIDYYKKTKKDNKKKETENPNGDSETPTI